MSFKCSGCNKVFWMPPVKLVTAKKNIVVRADDHRPGEKRPVSSEKLRDTERNRTGEEVIEVIACEAEFCPRCAVLREPDNREVQRRVAHEEKRAAFEREEMLREQLAAVKAEAANG